MNHFDPVMLFVGLLGFGMHFVLRFRKDPEPNLWKWAKTKENATYFLCSAGLSTVGLVFANNLMPVTSMTSYGIYSFFVCYNGGHFVAQFMDQKAVTPTKPKKVTKPLDKPLP